MIKIAINGLGRIGRPAFREALNNPNLEVVAVNDLADPETLVHLLRYDSVYGRYSKKVKFSQENLLVDGTFDGKRVKVLSEKNPAQLPWKEMGVKVVLECTGVFRHLKDAEQHLQAGAGQVIISAPAKGTGIPSFVLGVNEEQFNGQRVVDMGSCTTNCLAPVAKVLNDNYRINNGFMTTVHSYTSSQKLLDLPAKDLRRARAAALNIIPTTTGAAKAIGKVIPELKGRLDGMAIRVPSPTVSILDLVCELDQELTAEQLNYDFKQASQQDNFKGILGIEDAPLVSTDYRGNSYSAVVDAGSTRANGNMVKVLAWYDNEYAYAKRLVEFAEYVSQKK